MGGGGGCGDTTVVLEVILVKSCSGWAITSRGSSGFGDELWWLSHSYVGGYNFTRMLVVSLRFVRSWCYTL